MASKYGRTARSSAFQWFAHRITGTFLIFLLITHFWVQHYDRTTASISHSVVTADEAEAGVLPRYSEEAAEAVRAFEARDAAPATPDAPRVVPAQIGDPEGDAPGPTHPPGEVAGPTPYEVLMLRLGDPVYAVLWKGFNLLFLAFALHHGFYGLNNVLTDYIRNDMARVGATALSWTLALVLFVVGAYSVIVAGL
ncbi:succinate dehydrogenase [Rubrivirga marina]|uniref:Succinate dehydrogenase n=1 Tax=Rubrivirga marina TaxID=1196024 RepID=A0A271J428_9BACT|nr:succinate dehydrogenase [Rubrivirga marina]PAP78110.1 succinate dehydrogenase [Rubrivirga marina]